MFSLIDDIDKYTKINQSYDVVANRSLLSDFNNFMDAESKKQTALKKLIQENSKALSEGAKV